MAVTDLISWKKNDSNLTVHRNADEDALLDFRSQINRLFDDFFVRPMGLSPFFGEAGLMRDFAPRLDISETEKEITISAELPGLA